MRDSLPTDDADNIWLRPRPRRPQPGGVAQPWGAWACCLLCAGIYLLILASGGPDGVPSLAFTLYPRPSEIWDGAWWGPLTSAFVHFDLFHAGFNIYWLFLFGRALEQHFGTLALLGIVIASGFLASSFQLAFSDSGSIGASGINYALFGFLWIARRRVPDLHEVVPDRIVKFFLFWLVLCFFLTKAGLWPVANAAHTAGLGLGVLLGFVFALREKRPLTIPALGLAVALCVLPLFYVPWSIGWLAHRAYSAHNDGRFREAIELYDRILKREPGDDWASGNREKALIALGMKALEK